MKKIIYSGLIFTMLFLLSMCKKADKTENPLLSDFNTPFKVPPFQFIDTTHFFPAFIEGMEQENAEIESIVNNPEEPDFKNTILAFDRSGKLLKRISSVFNPLNSAKTNPQMQSIARRIDPLLSRHRDGIYMNGELFSRIRTVYDKRNELGLDSQQMRVLNKYYNDFVRRGSNLPEDQQEKLREINEELSMLSLTYGENLLAETNDNFRLVIEDAADLGGLPESVVKSAEIAAEELNMPDKWLFTLAKPSMIPFLQYAHNRELREKIYTGYFMRGNNDDKNDNKEIIQKLVSLRLQKARLLGYETYADYVIEENMAKTPEAVYEFLYQLWDPAIQLARKEAFEMQRIIEREGGTFKLQSWDWWYYTEKVRKNRYNLDESELKPYFSLTNVRDGMFLVANELYGINLKQRPDIPVYHPDVEAFEVTEADGSHIGILYLDYYPRAGKRVGAWCTTFRSPGWEEEERIHPVVSIVCNFTMPTEETPALLNWDEVLTLFHEFGHALHVLFTEGKFKRTAGEVPRDYVELPSQIMENWAAEPEVLKNYAKHFETAAVIPDALVEKLNNSSLFNKGFETTEYLAASILDMDLHSLTDTLSVDVLSFEDACMNRIGLISEIIPRYRSTYFQHIFSGGYSAGYYVYYWAAQLDADAFLAFKESGDIFNRDLAAKFRKYCLAESGNEEGMVQYIKFRGKEPSVHAMVERMGLNQK
ncbi:MAG: M3 family metallopeptidase [Bacteroidales bacterium]|nr:M3 family metallopeptidase [Bacteroidales bacterium]